MNEVIECALSWDGNTRGDDGPMQNEFPEVRLELIDTMAEFFTLPDRGYESILDCDGLVPQFDPLRRRSVRR